MKSRSFRVRLKAAAAIALAEAGYAAPQPRIVPAAGEAALANLKLGIHMMRRAEYISDHDVVVSTRLAHVLCGGAVAPGETRYTEEIVRDAVFLLMAVHLVWRPTSPFSVDGFIRNGPSRQA